MLLLLDPTNDCVRQGYRSYVHFNVKQKMVAAKFNHRHTAGKDRIRQ